MILQHLSMKIQGITKSYLVIILVITLMILQLSLINVILSLDNVSYFTEIFISFIFEQLHLFILGSLFFCFGIWYLYRPLAIVYVFVKNKLSISSFFCNQETQKNFNSSYTLDNQYKWISRLTNKISKKLTIKVPKVIIDLSSDVNAKVLPGFFHAPLIVLTQGLLNKLTPDEVEAVLAHEMAHVAMYDTHSMSVTDLILLITLWIPVYISHIIIDYVFLYRWRHKNIGFIVSLFVVLITYGFFALFVLNAINRRYELRADKLAMTMVNLHSFLNALDRVHASQSHIPGALEWCMAYMPKVMRPFILKVFLSHPSIPTRIQALR